MPVDFQTVALSLYRQPAVEAECLNYQEVYEVSIPLLLCCAWLDLSGSGASVEQVKSLPAEILAWEQAIVWPIRRARRALKRESVSSRSVSTLRTQIKQAELMAEMEVMARLSALPWHKSPIGALDSLAVVHKIDSKRDAFGALRAAMRQLGSDTLTGPNN